MVCRRGLQENFYLSMVWYLIGELGKGVKKIRGGL